MYTLHNKNSRKELCTRVGQNALGQCDSEEADGGFPFGFFFLSP